MPTKRVEDGLLETRRPNFRNKKNRNKQPDSAFAGLVKLLYGVLQCIHHIRLLEENLVNSTLPKAMRNKVEGLNSFIKPAQKTC